MSADSFEAQTALTPFSAQTDAFMGGSARRSGEHKGATGLQSILLEGLVNPNPRVAPAELSAILLNGGIKKV